MRVSSRTRSIKVVILRLLVSVSFYQVNRSLVDLRFVEVDIAVIPAGAYVKIHREPIYQDHGALLFVVDGDTVEHRGIEPF